MDLSSSRLSRESCSTPFKGGGRRGGDGSKALGGGVGVAKANQAKLSYNKKVVN